MKILITDPHLKGGGQVRYVTSLARELTLLGHEVIVGCKPGSMLEALAREAGGKTLSVFHFRGGLRPHCWLHDVLELRRFILRERPDVLHASGSQDHWVSAITNQLLGRPVCVVRTRHNTYPVSDAWPNRILNRSWTDFQIVVCETVRSRLALQRAFNERRMTTIHNGVDATFYAPDSDARKAIRRELGYADDHIVLAIAARLTAAKGHEFLFRATALLRSEYPNLRLLMLGQGVLSKRLPKLAVECGIAEITTFAGFRQDVARCIQAFDIGAQPSIDCEASSFSLMEQMATEVPIVTSDHGGSKEIVRDGIDGFVVPAGTVEPLADALRKLVADPNLRAQMGRSARQRIVAEFSAQKLAARTVDAYHKALEIHRERTTPG